MTNFSESTRRQFLQTSAASTLALGTASLSLGANAPSNKLVVGVMGTKGRGTTLATTFATLPGVEVAYVCDVDSRNIAFCSNAVAKKQERATKGVTDFRRILDDDEVDILAIATPDHWHAPGAIAGCNAGKHVYVEKPCCHNAQEGEWLVQAARKHKRVVQQGTQRRSYPGIMEGIQRLHEGEIGRVISARCWYFNERPTIGNGKPVDVPEWLDWDLWQGPAPRTKFHDNYVHYNWHWFWKWGTSEVGNNGVHSLDVCRWGLQVDYPETITSNGGKYRYPDDDQETPDTNMCTFTFAGNKTISWEGRSWGGRADFESDAIAAFYGENGIMTINGGGYKIYDRKRKEIDKGSGPGGNESHLQNFVDAIRGEGEATAEIGEGYKSALLCHLANIGYRTQSMLQFDPKTQKIIGNDDAMKLWGREYEPGWEPKVS